ncbi:sugar transporter SWEET1-like [Rhodnius prolixus]|uniref:Sugar transporter SWEET1 n=1 Tax=Rhodnius prolixus TaxID=13249 RepID=R4G498_RHOPR
MGLEDYKNIVGAAAGIATIAQFFSPLIICRNIIQQKDTRNVDPTPFIGGIGISLLMLQHGLILNDPAMIPVNIVGLILNIVYLSVFYTYTKDKFDVFRSLGKVIAGVAVLITYAQLESEERIEFNFGVIVTILLLTLIGAPLFNLKEILRSQDTSSLPFPMISCGTVVTFLWLLYGIIIKNIFIQIQNVVGCTLCSVQLALCLMYPGKPRRKVE